MSENIFEVDQTHEIIIVQFIIARTISSRTFKLSAIFERVKLVRQMQNIAVLSCQHCFTDCNRCQAYARVASQGRSFAGLPQYAMLCHLPAY